MEQIYAVTLRRLILVVSLLATLATSGCALINRDSDSQARRSTQLKTAAANDAITDEWLRKYNIAAQTELARAWRYGKRAGWRNRYKKVLAGVLRYDKQHADYFATEMENTTYGTKLDAVNIAAITKIFQNHRVVINWQYHDYANGDFLWKLGEPYRLADPVRDIIFELYQPKRFEIPDLETVTTDNIRANRQISDYAFLAPAAIGKLSERFGWNADVAVQTVATHEAAHHINEQIVIQEGSNRELIYGFYLEEMSQAIPEIDFYTASEVEEFLADAVAIQTSAISPFPQEVVGFFVNRNLRPATEFRRITRDGKEIRQVPHLASAEFVYRLLREEEARRGYNERHRYSIARLRSADGDDDWIDREWLPYLDHMLTDEFVVTIREAYRRAFDAIGGVLWYKDRS